MRKQIEHSKASESPRAYLNAKDFLGKYKVIKKVSEGAYAKVYEVVDTVTKDTRILKLVISYELDYLLVSLESCLWEWSQCHEAAQKT